MDLEAKGKTEMANSISEIKRGSSPDDEIFISVGKDACEINSHKVGYGQIMMIYFCHKTVTYEVLDDTFWKPEWLHKDCVREENVFWGF